MLDRRPKRANCPRLVPWSVSHSPSVRKAFLTSHSTGGCFVLGANQALYDMLEKLGSEVRSSGSELAVLVPEYGIHALLIHILHSLVF